MMLIMFEPNGLLAVFAKSYSKAKFEYIYVIAKAYMEAYNIVQRDIVY
jgi:hypothetical protein